MGFPCCSAGKESACNAGNTGSDPGWGRCPGEENGNPLQYSCLESPVDGGAWRAPVHGFQESDTTRQRSHTKGSYVQRMFGVVNSNRQFLWGQLSFTLTRALKNGLYEIGFFSVYCVVGKEQISQDGGVRLPRPAASPSCRALCEQGFRSSRARIEHCACASRGTRAARAAFAQLLYMGFTRQSPEAVCPYVVLCYVCCYGSCASQQRINASAVPRLPRIFFQPLSPCLAHHGFREQCRQWDIARQLIM